MNEHPLRDPVFWIIFILAIAGALAIHLQIETTIHQPRGTTVKKTHIYTVTVSRNAGKSIVVHVRAESKAQARAAVANTMIHVERADNDTVLDLNRSDVIDANSVPMPADDQAALPLTPPDDNAPPPTAADVMEPAALTDPA